MWIYFIVVIFASIYGGLDAVPGSEGSGGGNDLVKNERLVDYSNNEGLTFEPGETPLCVLKSFPCVDGLNFKGQFYNEMFICPNGFIGLTDENMQAWPYIIGTLTTHKTSSYLAPYWSRVDLSLLQTPRESKVFHNSYHADFNYNVQVFNKVNNDVRTFINDNNFSAKCVSVVTWENLKPHGSSSGFEGTNTFQVAIVSDETKFYIIYNYGAMDWSVNAARADYHQHLNQAGLPVMGYSAGENGSYYRDPEEFHNLAYSGTVNAECIDDYNGNLGTGRFIFEAGITVQKTAALECYEWYRQQSSNPVTPNIDLQCPDTFATASLDARFIKFNTNETFFQNCFVNQFPMNGTAVLCCYESSGALIKAPPNAGGVLSKNPLYYEIDDLYGYKKCCIESERCDAYYSVRSIQDGESYIAQNWAWGYGDPHYSNMDKMNYTFNGCGDFIFLDSDNPRFQIQVRFTRALGAGLGTIISAVVIKQSNLSAIQINLKAGGGILFLVNGVEYSDYSSFGRTASLIEGSYAVSKPEQNRLIITTINGNGIEVRDEVSHLILTIVLDQHLFGKTKGLLGNWSRTTNDDWLLPNGTILTPPLTDEQIHHDFGEKWRLSSGQNRFVNTTADADFGCPADYAPIFFTNYTFPNSSFANEAKLICGDNFNCLFDIAATLSPDFGQTTRNVSATIENDNAIIENSAPAFTVKSVTLNLTLGSRTEYTVTATDSNGDPINIKAEGLPAGATTSTAANSLTFSWLVDSITPFELNFIATDDKGASASLVPFINVCACENGGTCYKKDESELTALINFKQFYVLDCQCAVGYTGQLCKTARDFCQTTSGSPCHPLANCTNSPTSYICGPCPTGYGGNGQNCTDIDECASSTHDCAQVCRNSAGSFQCQCNLGYQLNADKKSCNDINECEKGHGCMHTCTNTLGSYTCSCLTNFKVDENNPRDCKPINECPAGHSCTQVCFVDQSSGQQTCSCNRGYKLDGDGKTCVDADECTEPTNLCSQTCTNTQGSYNCFCIQGYRLHSNGYTCNDINECIEDPSSCSTATGEICQNLAGSFKCDCNENQGLILINGTCQVPKNPQNSDGQPAPEPPIATSTQRTNAVEFRISNFQSNQWLKKTDTAFRNALAEALTEYCSANEERRNECRLPGFGYTFTELHVNRIQNQPVNDGNDALVSFYATYPNGTGITEPVAQSVLLNAWTEHLDKIKQQTSLTLKITTEEQQTPSKGENDLDWPLVLGVCIAGVLLLTMGCCILILVCGKGKAMLAPKEEFYERRRWSFSEIDEPYPVSGDSYQGFDEDGLPVELGNSPC